MTKELATKADAIIAKFGDAFAVDSSDLSAGATGSGFGVMSFRASKWRAKHGGEEELVVDEQGEPVASIKVVILRGSKAVSKSYYEEAYSDGADAAPTCQSVNGVVPDDGSLVKQAASCAACPKGQWGSKITPSGKKAKACSDSRRLAIVPDGDLLNERYGGPMLLRVPAASLKDLAAFSDGMQRKGFPYNAIITRIGFDPDASYPKLTFKPVRALTVEELEVVAGLITSSPVIDEILSKPSEPRDDQEAAAPKATPRPTPAPTPAPTPSPTVSTDFEDEAPAKPATSVKKTYAKKAPAAAPVQAAAAAKPAAATAPAKSSKETSLEQDLDELLAGVEL